MPYILFIMNFTIYNISFIYCYLSRDVYYVHETCKPVAFLNLNLTCKMYGANYFFEMKISFALLVTPHFLPVKR